MVGQNKSSNMLHVTLVFGKLQWTLKRQYVNVCSVLLPCVTVQRTTRVERTRVWGQGQRDRGQLLQAPTGTPLKELGRSGPSVWDTVECVGAFDSSSPIRRRVADSATCCAKNTLSHCNKFTTVPGLKSLLFYSCTTPSNTSVEIEKSVRQSQQVLIKAINQSTTVIIQDLCSSKAGGFQTQYIPLSTETSDPNPLPS